MNMISIDRLINAKEKALKLQSESDDETLVVVLQLVMDEIDKRLNGERDVYNDFE